MSRQPQVCYLLRFLRLPFAAGAVARISGVDITSAALPLNRSTADFAYHLQSPLQTCQDCYERMD